MEIENAGDYFDLLASHGRDPRLADATGAWHFDVKGVGTWTVDVDHGELRVSQGGGEPNRVPSLSVELSERELVRVARGDNHENVLTALLRGAVRIRGDIVFGQKLQAVLPIPDEWRHS
jgi:hypothetical protein